MRCRSAVAGAILAALGASAAWGAGAEAVRNQLKLLHAAKFADQSAAFMRLLSFGKDAEAGLAEEKKMLDGKLIELPQELIALKEGKKTDEARGPKAIGRELKDVRVTGKWVEALLAEIEAMRNWTDELPPALEGKLNVTVNLAFRDEPLGKALASAGRQTGATVVLSPAAAKIHRIQVLEVTGTASLGEFLEWVCDKFELRVGAADGKIVVAPKV